MLFKNVSGDDLDIPALGLQVKAGEKFEATGDDAQSLLKSPLFERVDKPQPRTSNDNDGES